jgi:uncharacterized protein YybS (DUF2232 family)
MVVVVMRTSVGRGLFARLRLPPRISNDRHQAVAVPDQRKWILGAEYLVVGLVVIGVALVLDRRAGTQRGSVVGGAWTRSNPTFVTCSLLVIAAVILVLGHKDGIYLLVPALIVVLVGGVVNAWLILVRLTD